MKKLSFFNKVVFILNAGAATALLLSYLAAYVNPATLWALAFFGLAYPFLLLANLLFILYWLLVSKRKYLLSLVTVLIGWSYIWGTVQFNFGSEKEDGANTMKVMSYNVRLFDLYNWTNNEDARDQIFDLIRKEAPEVLCLQEFFHSDEKDYFTTLDTLIKLQDATNFHAEYTSTVQDKYHFGIATFSKHPIVNKGKVEFEVRQSANNDCIFTDIKINEDTIRVYNMHLASIHLGYDDYRFLEDIGEVETEEQIQGGKQIMKLLKKAFIERASQADQIAEHISSSPYPVIVCGDFNDSPSSYAYHTISSGLNDAFRESGVGLGISYNGTFPAFRIDYILHSDSLKSHHYETLPDELSDHFPIICDIELSN